MPQVPPPYIPPPQSPLVRLGAALEVASRAREQQAVDEQAREREALKSALKLYPNDPDKAVGWLASSGYPSASATLQEHVSKLRSENATRISTELKNRGAQMDLALGMLTASKGNPAVWPYVRQVTEALAPHLLPLLSEQYDEAAIDRLASAGLSAKELIEQQNKALDRLMKGEYHAGASMALGFARSQEEWDEALRALQAVGTPTEVLAAFGPAWSPDAALRARALGLTPQQRVQAEQEEQRRQAQAVQDARTHDVALRNVRVAEGNLAMRRREFDFQKSQEPLVAYLDAQNRPHLARRSEVPKDAKPIQAGGGAMPVAYGERLVRTEGAMLSLARMEALVLDKNGRVREDRKPWLGPVAGRASRAQLELPMPFEAWEPSDELAEFYAHTATVTNAIINAITGAALGEKEAERISRQIPQLTDKPVLWRQKMNATRANMRYLRRRLAALGKGALANELLGQTDAEVGEGTPADPAGLGIVVPPPQ